MILSYDDGEPVELFDHVDLTLEGHVFDGQITRLHPRKGAVRVGYRDSFLTTRRGEPTWRSAEVPVARVALLRRGG